MIKRIKNLNVNSYPFKIIWDPKKRGGWFDYEDLTITIGTENQTESELFMILCHELSEICSVEMHIRYSRSDCPEDRIFVYDHRQHDTMINMFASLLKQFLE